MAPGTNAVTLYAGHGPTAVADQLSRNPESLARSMAASLRGEMSTKLARAFDAMLIVCPEHGRIFREAGWNKARLRQELDELLLLDGDDMIRGAGGIDEGIPKKFAGAKIPKFRPGGLHIVHAGGDAGLFSAILGGWAAGAVGSEVTTLEITN